MPCALQERRSYDRQFRRSNLCIPFCTARGKTRRVWMNALLESVQQKAQHSIDVKQQFFSANAAQIVTVARALANVYEQGGKLFTMGNGGSSCDASHIAVEFLHPVTAGRPALPAVNLVADTAMMTAVGNDVGFAHIFVRQLIAQARRGDALIGISTSGNSDNLLTAFAKAKEMGIVTIGLAGGDGGRDEAEPRRRSLLWSYQATAFIACRNVTSRSITSFGIWCIRCWPINAADLSAQE